MNTSSDSGVHPSFSLINDEPDNSSTKAKLKLKVDVVSVTVEQHTEGRLQDSQSLLDLNVTMPSNVSPRRTHANRMSCCSFGFSSETSMSPLQQGSERSV